MINEVVGDLFDADVDVICHGANAKGRMGSGVAKIVRERYPEAYNAYIREYRDRGLYLGRNIYVKINSAFWVVNMITQEEYGYDGRAYASYDAIKECFERLFKFMDSMGLKKVACPRIGSGLGGLNYLKIKEILDEITPEVIELTIYSLTE
jgi:O-acetyl-ADP-ribose deacetylase (regulator of RNase III)